MTEFAMQKDLALGFDEALVRVTEALATEGFGIVTQLDVQAVFAQKLGEQFRKYRVLGACNPKLAHRALSATLLAGVMIPCNVILWERGEGQSTVAAVDPAQVPAATSVPAIAELAAEVRERLARVLEKLG